ncbi:Glucose-6-phosphate 1-dehydrogenase [compost metagenome]
MSCQAAGLQYAAGEIKGRPVDAYTSEPGIDSSSRNETYIAARLYIDDPLWDEVPFYIRTGKRMKEKSARIVIEFKEPFNDLHNLNRLNLDPNLLIIDIGPGEGISLQLNTKNPRQHGQLEPVSIKHESANPDLPEAYENLIYDALLGDAHWWLDEPTSDVHNSITAVHAADSEAVRPGA